MRPQAMIFLFAVVTALTVWEYTGLVNNIEGVCVNRFITTAAGTYLFLAFAGFCSDITPSAVFIPYLLTVIYLFISELYTEGQPNKQLGLHHALAALHRPALCHDQRCGVQKRGRRDGLRQHVAAEHLHLPVDKRYGSPTSVARSLASTSSSHASVQARVGKAALAAASWCLPWQRSLAIS